MATHPGPRPKRKDCVTKLGFEIAMSTWNTMNDLYRMDKQRERELAQAERQRQREERAAQARLARQRQQASERERQNAERRESARRHGRYPGSTRYVGSNHVSDGNPYDHTDLEVTDLDGRWSTIHSTDPSDIALGNSVRDAKQQIRREKRR